MKEKNEGKIKEREKCRKNVGKKQKNVGQNEDENDKDKEFKMLNKISVANK